MSKIIRKEIRSGPVLEVIIARVSDRVDITKVNPERPPRNDIDRQRHLDGISRRRMERLINTNFTCESFFVTLTIDEAHYVDSFDYVIHEFAKYKRRIQRRFPDAKMLWVYGGMLGGLRIHIHMVIDGVPEDQIGNLWTLGKIKKIEHLRAHNYDPITHEDYGRDFKMLANYMFGHWSSEQGSPRRYHATTNLVVPEISEAEELEEAPAAGEVPDVPDCYVLIDYISTGYGLQITRFVTHDPDKFYPSPPPPHPPWVSLESSLKSKVI